MRWLSLATSGICHIYLALPQNFFCGLNTPIWAGMSHQAKSHELTIKLSRNLVVVFSKTLFHPSGSCKCLSGFPNISGDFNRIDSFYVYPSSCYPQLFDTSFTFWCNKKKLCKMENTVVSIKWLRIPQKHRKKCSKLVDLLNTFKRYSKNLPIKC